MTTRKLFAAAAALALAGCATPGPLHLYTAASPSPASVRDLGGEPPATAEVPSYLESGETLTGFAYDPFTDHFFLRLAPGNKIRVIDRPARKIKREFTVAQLPAAGGGDLAVRPATGHIFFAHPSEPALIETSRLGEFIRAIPLETLTAPPGGVAYDSAHDRLLILSGGDLSSITVHDRDGQKISVITLDRTVARTSLAFDPLVREFFVPLCKISPLLGNYLGMYDGVDRTTDGGRCGSG